MFDKQTIKDAKIKDKTILVRTDYNVPLEDGVVKNDLRIRASLPTLEYLRKNGAKRIVLISHLGRPEGRDKSLSLKPVAEALARLIGDVYFIDDVSGPDVENSVENLPKGGILLLENLRFYPGEEKNSEDFAREIVDATHPDLFVQDGFAVIHRAHASTSAITKELPSVAGLLVEKEVENLTRLTKNPAHPFLVILGGAKVADKQPLIDQFEKLADEIYVGGKIAADGYVSDDPKIAVAQDFRTDEQGNRCDISDQDAEALIEKIAKAKTILWNGTLGQVEIPAFAESSTKVAHAISAQTAQGATTVICGGDTTAFAEEFQDLNFTLLSTGGGASLELLTGNPLPGLDSLD